MKNSIAIAHGQENAVVSIEGFWFLSRVITIHTLLIRIYEIIIIIIITTYFTLIYINIRLYQNVIVKPYYLFMYIYLYIFNV